ncbi:AraC family transcriptional regulator N-terminal domain-containing protein [Silvibacterium sp.]|uniref:AraC family transcriptional regulator n=1 Tax=Silvibacterium sp. TaxID=1964179 RepID=UPI0039E5E52E
MPSERNERSRRLAELARALRRYTDSHDGANPYMTAIEGFAILRSDRPRQPSHRLFRPALCITAQGAKWAIFGDRRYVYRAGQALVVSVEMPSRGGVLSASPDEPFLGIVLQLDLGILHDVAAELQTRIPASTTSTSAKSLSGVSVVDMNVELLDCALRCIRLLDTPGAIALLYPGIMREICYWLLTGPGGEQIFRALAGSQQEERLIAAIQALKEHFAEPVRVESLAAIAHMSPATFHRQFKSVTAMTPLQYQKQIRLLEARRLMLATRANVETAAFQVGYESASQFSREYARMFGRSPRRDVLALRNSDALAAD